MGWYWLGRVRHRTFFIRPGATKQQDVWLPCRVLHVLATAQPQDLGEMKIARYRPLLARLVLTYRATPTCCVS